MEFKIVAIIIYLYNILYNPRKEKFEKYLQACKKIYSTYIISPETFVIQGIDNFHLLFTF